MLGHSTYLSGVAQHNIMPGCVPCGLNLSVILVRPQQKNSDIYHVLECLAYGDILHCQTLMVLLCFSNSYVWTCVVSVHCASRYWLMQVCLTLSAFMFNSIWAMFCGLWNAIWDMCV